MALAALTPSVLCYHRIGGPLELGVTRVGRGVFARQLTALARAGWKTLTLEEFAARVRRAVVPSGHELLVSFDDAYASLADHAYPVLRDLGFTATTFVITDFVGRHNTWDVRYTWRRLAHLDWPAIERWHGRGFDFASHGASHRRLTWLEPTAIGEELMRSRATLAGRLGAAAGRGVAYPFGAVDARVLRLARDAGYELGFGGVRGTGDSLHLPRIPVYSWDVGPVPLGLRTDALGALSRALAYGANRCAVGTSMMLTLRVRRRTAPPPESAADA